MARILFIGDVMPGTTGSDVVAEVPSGDGLFSEFRKLINSGIDALETEQSKVNKAFFDALSMGQRDAFCQSLDSQGVKSRRIEKITGKSQPTVNRHLNGKSS